MEGGYACASVGTWLSAAPSPAALMPLKPCVCVCARARKCLCACVRACMRVRVCEAWEAIKLIPAWEADKLIPMARKAPRWCGGRHFHYAEYLPLLSIQ